MAVPCFCSSVTADMKHFRCRMKYRAHGILHTAYSVHCAAYSIQHTLCGIQRTAHSVHCASYSIQHTAYIERHTAYSIQHTLCGIQHTAYSIHGTVCYKQLAVHIVVSGVLTSDGRRLTEHFAVCASNCYKNQTEAEK